MQLAGAGLAPLRDGVGFAHRMPVGPSTGDVEDPRFLARTAGRVRLTRVVALQTNFQVHRDAIPPPGEELRDGRSLSAGILRSVR